MSLDHVFEVQRSRCLALLKTRGLDGADTAELSDPNVGGHDGTRRVRELRAIGYPVQRTRLSTGYWKYWLGPSTDPRPIDLPWDEEDDDPTTDGAAS